MNLESLAPLEERCAICDSPLRWCVGGMECPREDDTDHDGRCLACGEDEGECECDAEVAP